MAGVVLETVSNRKIITLGIVALVLQLIFFLVGALVAPAPSNFQLVLGTLCLDMRDRPKDTWFYPRGPEHVICKKVHDVDDAFINEYHINANQVVFSFQLPLPRDGVEIYMSRFQNLLAVLQADISPNIRYAIGAPAPSNDQLVLGTLCVDMRDRPKDTWHYPRGPENETCKKVHDVDDAFIKEHHINANQVVFSFQLPLPRDGMELDMSRWFQNILAVLQADIDYSKEAVMDDDALITFDIRLGYRNKGQANWTEIVHTTEQRSLQCAVEKYEEGYPLKCDLMPLFELGSCQYDSYLVNIRIPVDDASGLNIGIGRLRDLTMVTMHQNGGFTKFWFSIKSTVFPILLLVLCWYLWRICRIERSANLLERTLFALGIVLSIMNMPVEWLTLRFNMPWMQLFGDGRQDLFYATLLCFWIIFTGGHMMEQVERNSLVMYWKSLTAVSFGCICLFVFEMCERGIQLTNPFYSIWVTKTWTRLALGFIILAGVSACLYFIFLSYMIFRVFRNISAKRSALHSMNEASRKYYSGLIYRFKFLMLVTLLASACTVIFFIISQVSEGQLKWYVSLNPYLENTSAFFTGVYGMWNIYVCALLILYAPSHKHVAVLETTAGSVLTSGFPKPPVNNADLENPWTVTVTDRTPITDLDILGATI